jgi:methionyl-tRNA formyltransferase
MSKKLNTIFFGSPDEAVVSMKELMRYTNLKAVITQPDSYQGRKKILTPTAVNQAITEYNLKLSSDSDKIPAFTPKSLKDGTLLASLQKISSIDFAVVCAYGKIIPPNVFNFPRLKTINIHFSILPRWRGASPVQSSLLAGDMKTGITIQLINEKMDEGDIILINEIPIDPDWQYTELMDSLIKLLPETIHQICTIFSNEDIHLTPQNHQEASYCYKIKTEDALINWEKPKLNIHNKIRAFNPKPGAFCIFRGKRIKILKSKVFTNSNLLPFMKSVRKIKTVRKALFNIQFSENQFQICIKNSQNSQRSDKEYVYLENGQILCLIDFCLLVFSPSASEEYKIELKNSKIFPFSPDNFLLIERLQPESKKEMSGLDFFNGSNLNWLDKFE